MSVLVGARPPAVQATEPPTPFYRDPVSCLHSTLAAVVYSHGGDPLEVLGAAWEFRSIPGDMRREEFYLPCRFPGDPARSVAPHHALRSRWCKPADDADPLGELAKHISSGYLPVAAVDNYHLPFRPAYHDVHAAHLLVVYGVDLARGLVLVSDAMPPSFTGALPVDDFCRAWASAEQPDDQRHFFSDALLDRQYMLVEIDGSIVPWDAGQLAAALEDNVARFRSASGPGWSGLAGLRRYLDSVADAAAADEAETVASVYTLGWGMQAAAALHGELLRTRGRQWRLASLREAGRAVESVAHCWTGLRVTAAHGRHDPHAAIDDLRRHSARLRARNEAAVDAVSTALAEL